MRHICSTGSDVCVIYVALEVTFACLYVIDTIYSQGASAVCKKAEKTKIGKKRHLYLITVQSSYFVPILLIWLTPRSLPFGLRYCPRSAGSRPPIPKITNIMGRIHEVEDFIVSYKVCLLYTSPSPRDKRQSRMPSSA